MSQGQAYFSWQQRFRKEGVLFKQKNELFIKLLAKL